MTGGRYRAGQYLFGKWLYSPPAWMTASADLVRIHRRMCFWDRISRRITIGLILVVLLALNSLVFVFGRMKKNEPNVAPKSTSPVGGSRTRTFGSEK